tara:strand:- start:914 stop:1075 length:162 start_codon:yes stop_codon:yes gene_type:complete
VGGNVGEWKLLKGREISGISFFFRSCVRGNFFEDVGVSFLLSLLTRRHKKRGP